ncbi:MAG: cobalt ECF transporter T component CbiQ [Chloroflexota bacterium]
MSAALSFLEQYQEGESFLHHADARVKLIVTLAFIATLTATPPRAWPVFLGYAVVEWSAVIGGGLSIRGTLKRSMLAPPFMLIAVPTVFTKPGDGLFSIPVLAWRWTATDQGLVFSLSVLTKSWISVIAAGTLAVVTPVTDLTRAMRFIRIPKILVAVMAFMYRYLFVLVDEAMRLMRAREARSARLGKKAGGPLLWRVRVAGHMVGSLFLRTYERSERIYMAMVARGYNGEVIILGQRRLTTVEGVFIIAVIATLVAAQVTAALIW